jgi:hypothetical protein
MKTAPILILAAACALGGCEAKVGKDHGSAPGTTAEGKAEENKLSISAPGFAMKVDMGDSLRSHSKIDSDDELFYPGATLAGMHIQANKGGGVEMRFTTPDAPDKVAAWYRDPARTGFTLDAGRQEKDALSFNGKAGDDGKNGFKLRLIPHGAGTEGVISIADTKDA